jgi:hypothetical protein
MLGNYINLEKKIKSPIKQKTNNINLIYKEKNEPLPQIKKMVYNNNNNNNNSIESLDPSIEFKQQISTNFETTSKQNLNNRNLTLTKMNSNLNLNNNHRELQKLVKPNCNFKYLLI